MTSKERVLRTLERRETDRVPFGTFGTSSENEERIRREIGAPTLEDMYRQVGLDIWNIWQPLVYVGESRHSGNETVDYWGIPDSVYRDGDSSQRCPLAEVSSVDEVEAYPWPSIDDFAPVGLHEMLDAHEEFAIIGGAWAPIFHNLTWLCGFETTLVNLVLQPEVSDALIRRITDFWVAYVRKSLDSGRGRIDIVENCNDFGSQRGPILSPELFRRFFRPALQRLYDAIRQGGAHVMQHSCGAITPLIPDLLEMGVEILNPIQVSAEGMEPESLATAYGGRVVFYGGIDTQHVLPEGPEERIRAETRRVLNTLGKSGGLILSGSQGLEADIPVRHVLAMFDEARR
jgi:uroporphyrinogen decarboxylase